MTKVLTIGTFDTPHMGHAYLLKECEKYGEVYVGVNTDAFVIQYKGQAPLFTWSERVRAIHAMGYRVVENRSAGRELIELVRPDVLVIGSDWATKDYYKQIDVTQEFLDNHRITMIYVPRVPGYSSTEMKSRARQ